MDASPFKPIFTLCLKARPVRAENFDADLKGVFGLFSNVTSRAAREVVERWTRYFGCLSALRDLNMI
ncbi:MAG: hypothetical protein VW338_09720 [Rhodospirillaceae bacterium]